MFGLKLNKSISNLKLWVEVAPEVDHLSQMFTIVYMQYTTSKNTTNNI